MKRARPWSVLFLVAALAVGCGGDDDERELHERVQREHLPGGGDVCCGWRVMREAGLLCGKL